MKKSRMLLLVLALLMSFAACGSETPPEPAETAGVPTAQEAEHAAGTDAGGEGIDTDENLLTGDITLPPSFFEGEDMAAFDPDAYAEEQRFQKAVLNSDNSVTVTMTKARHRELLAEMADSLETSFAAMMGAEDTPYIENITHTDDFGEITVDVNRAGYEAVVFELTPFALGMSGMMYQVFTESEPHVEVIVRDADTGDVIHSAVYPDDMDQGE
jgi:predicted small lipoprotein YifL